MSKGKTKNKTKNKPKSSSTWQDPPLTEAQRRKYNKQVIEGRFNRGVPGTTYPTYPKGGSRKKRRTRKYK